MKIEKRYRLLLQMLFSGVNLQAMLSGLHFVKNFISSIANISLQTYHMIWAITRGLKIKSGGNNVGVHGDCVKTIQMALRWIVKQNYACHNALRPKNAWHFTHM